MTTLFNKNKNITPTNKNLLFFPGVPPEKVCDGGSWDQQAQVCLDTTGRHNTLVLASKPALIQVSKIIECFW